MPPNHATLKNIVLYGLFGSNGEFLNVYICVYNLWCTLSPYILEELVSM